MTQEEKARAYDKALEQAKFYYNNKPLEPEKKKLEKMFPQLIETEDEKIMGVLWAIINEAKQGGIKSYYAVPIDDILGWIERHRELKWAKNAVSEDDDDETVRLKLISLINWSGTNWAEEDKDRFVAYLQQKKEQKQELHIPKDFGRAKYDCKGEYLALNEQKPDEMGENERIRKMLIKYFKELKVDSFINLEIPDILAWLEKQKDFAVNEYWRGYKNGREEVLENPSNFELQKEQKPLSTEETELNSIAFLEQLGYTCIPPKEQKPAELLDTMLSKDPHLPKQTVKYGQKPIEWSEEDKAWLSEVYFAIDNSMYSDDEKKAMKKYIDHLRSQSNSAEWSEEDSTYLADALWCIEQAEKYAQSENDLGACWCARKFLKSLRPQPKRNCKECAMFLCGECTRPHWKPSEEQMKALKECGGCKKAIAELYNDLMKP